MPRLFPIVSLLLEMSNCFETATSGSLLLGALGLVPVAVYVAGRVFPHEDRFAPASEL